MKWIMVNWICYIKMMSARNQKAFTTFMRTERGFTLIELLVVISIIAILSVVGLVSFQNIQSRAKDAKIKADLNAIKKAYEANYDPTLNGGQGGYQVLKDSDFASGKIPTQPNGSQYPCKVGPAGGEYHCDAPSSEGYQVSATLSNGTTTSVISNQGTIPASQLNSCDPGGVLNNGLVAFWNLEEGPSGTSVPTSPVNSSLAGAISGATWDSTDKITGSTYSLNFNSGQSVSIPHDLSLNSNNMAVSFWMKPVLFTSQDNAQYQRVIQINNQWEIVMLNGYNAGWSDRGILQLKTGPIMFDVAAMPNVFGDSNWHHILVTYSSTAGGVFYADGVKKSWDCQANCTGNIKYINNSNLIFGGQYQGKLDKIRIYNTAITDPGIINLLLKDGNGC